MPAEIENESDQSARRLARVIEALRADFERQGYLTDDQVVRAVHKRKIEAEGHLIVQQELANAGIVVEGATSERGYESGHALIDTSGDDSVRRYLVEIGKYRLLRAEDEITLGRRIQIGRRALDALGLSNDLTDEERAELLRLHQTGREAEQQMISSNLRLVVSIAKRYSKTLSLDFLDLIQEGTLGLMRAVERFDHQRGFKFSTYATWWIIQAITRGIADKDRLIRLPVHAIEALGKLRRLRRRLSASMMGAEPNPRELAVHLSWTPEKVRLLLSVMDDAISLDAPVADIEESSLGDLLSAMIPDPEEIVADAEKAHHIGAIVDGLGGVMPEIIRLRFGMGTPEELTLQEIGDLKGVTRERIRQIEAKALGRLHHRSRELRHFLDCRRARREQVKSTPPEEKTGEARAPKRITPASRGGVLTTIFFRLPVRTREILALRYGLDGRESLSEEEMSARLGIDSETLRRLEFSALDTLGHNRDSFRRLIGENAVIRESLAWRSTDLRSSKAGESGERKREARTHDD